MEGRLGERSPTDVRQRPGRAARQSRSLAGPERDGLRTEFGFARYPKRYADGRSVRHLLTDRVMPMTVTPLAARYLQIRERTMSARRARALTCQRAALGHHTRLPRQGPFHDIKNLSANDSWFDRDWRIGPKPAVSAGVRALTAADLRKGFIATTLAPGSFLTKDRRHARRYRVFIKSAAGLRFADRRQLFFPAEHLLLSIPMSMKCSTVIWGSGLRRHLFRPQRFAVQPRPFRLASSLCSKW
jgi:hypothetical protein